MCHDGVGFVKGGEVGAGSADGVGALHGAAADELLHPYGVVVGVGVLVLVGLVHPCDDAYLLAARGVHAAECDCVAAAGGEQPAPALRGLCGPVHAPTDYC